MSVTIPSILANVTLGHLNFTANCSNLVLGFQVWNDDFLVGDPDPGNSTEDDSTADDGPSSYYNDIWTNGTSPEFIGFWRVSLGSVLPDSYLDFTDAQIAAWTNHTEFYDFFQDDVLNWPQPNQLFTLANYLASSGGCSNNATSSPQQDLTLYSSFQQACMIQYCCTTAGNTQDETSQAPFPYFPDWTIEGACAFDTCSRANGGNPDLGGIGIIVAYFIEASLIFLSLIFFGIKFITDWRIDRPRKGKGQLLDQHDSAMVAAAGVFIDNAVFFALAINFASIIFNYRDEPLLYEDKLGQTSSLLGIDAPVSILLLSYNQIDRRNLRITVVFLAALMTFIIQFLFRRAKSFNPSTSLCLAWDDAVQFWFTQRFEAKAVWSCLVLIYIVWAFSDHLMPRKLFSKRKSTELDMRKSSMWPKTYWRKVKRSKVLVFFGRLFNPFNRLFRAIYDFTNWRPIVAYLLAAYGLFAIIIEIRFILFLRRQEKSIGTQDQDDHWGYGQILALFVWVPVFVEYVYIFGRERQLWGSRDSYNRHTKEERRTYEMIEQAYDKDHKHQLPEQTYGQGHEYQLPEMQFEAGLLRARD